AALYLNLKTGEPVPPGKCDDGVAYGIVGNMESWSSLGQNSSSYDSENLVISTGRRGPGANVPVLTNTIVHLFEPGYDSPGDWVFAMNDPSSEPGFFGGPFLRIAASVSNPSPYDWVFIYDVTDMENGAPYPDDWDYVDWMYLSSCSQTPGDTA